MTNDVKLDEKSKRISLNWCAAETALLCAYALGWHGALTIYATGVTVAMSLVLFALVWFWKKRAMLPKRARSFSLRDIVFGTWRIATIATLLYFTQYLLAGIQTVAWLLGLYAVVRNRVKTA